ncbi:hypothetical protein [Guptibacillus spartinae]|uniref:hypothetical protein n=1 Tax=Guptibacillus spartinae TaxID=3025679 RepID=UPI00235F43F8|nr:hypothetical protein [Pseudalkalibacillus spartinae]
MKHAIITLLLIFSLIGCSSATDGNEESKSFETRQDAIEYGLELEDIEKDDILDTMSLEDQEIVLFQFSEQEGEGITLAELTKQDGEFQWKRSIQRVVLKSEDPSIGNLNVETTFEMSSGKEYALYLGVADEEGMTIETDIGEVTPTTTNGMYYYLQS